MTHQLCGAVASVLAVINIAAAGEPELPWQTAADFSIERVGTGYRLPVNIAFVPNPDSSPDAPLYYVAELYGSIQVVKRDGTKSTFATGLLDYNPEGPIGGIGEQGLTGIAVERDPVNPAIYHLYVTMLWDNGAPPGGSSHYPKIERITSAPGGLTMASRTIILNMQPETQGQAHQISNITIGPDTRLYVHMGDGFNAASALDLNQFRGKILRVNKSGVAPQTNPFYNANNGIGAADYVYTYGHRNPFGGAWMLSNGKHYIVENGNSIDRLVDLTPGASYGWAGSDDAINNNALYVWNPGVAPVNIAIVQSAVHNGSGFPDAYFDRAYVTQSGDTYAAGPSDGRSKCISEFADLITLGPNGKLLIQPRTIAWYTGTGRSTAVALAAGPDGLYFSDFYEETGANGPTAAGSNIYRLSYRNTCLGDFVGSKTFEPPPDGTINAADLAYLLGQWGSNPGSPADIVSNATFSPPPDGVVDGADLASLLAGWADCH